MKLLKNMNKLWIFETGAVIWITQILTDSVDGIISKTLLFVAIFLKYVIDLRIRKIIIDELSSKQSNDSE